MDPLIIGGRYSKSDLSSLLKNDNLSLVREGIYNFSTDNRTFLFVDLEKEEWFNWDSQTTQHLDSPRIQEIIKGVRDVHLFVRIRQKVKTKTQPFVYCGRVEYEMYDPDKTFKPIHIIFRSIDFQDNTDNPFLQEIYQWKPAKGGKTTSNTISRQGVVSDKRKRTYTRPNKTERSGLVTSRVGQGYYRQQIREKWGSTCPVTGVQITGILIASHIVPWSESTDQERLDPNNGILLSPNIDSLFDRHLVSFTSAGNMVVSPKISKDELISLGIDSNAKIPVNDEMIVYLERHFLKFKNQSG
jgi:hypothetical protein